MRDILTGIGAALLISLCIVFVLGCSSDKGYPHSSDLQTIVSHFGREQWPKVIQDLCQIGRISHSTHVRWISLISNPPPVSVDRQDIEIQEFRQNITDLQNRVYELENR